MAREPTGGLRRIMINTGEHSIASGRTAFGKGVVVHSAMEGEGPQIDFAQVYARLPTALYTTDEAGRITSCNEAAIVLWGREPSFGEDRWCGAHRMYWPDGSPMPHDQCPMATCLRSAKPIHGAEAIGERPDGSRYAFAAYPTPLLDKEGEITGAVNMLVDITAREDIEIASRRLAAIVESSEDAIVSKTLDGVITSWNAGAERLFGYSADEIVGRPILTLIPPDRHSEEDEIIGQLRAGKRVKHFETVRRRKDGSEIPVSLSVSPIRRADGTVIGASKIARDISERKRTEELLGGQARRLETLNRVASEISRDLDLDRIVQTVTDIATELTGAKFGAFFYNVLDEAGESYQLYSLTGAPRDAFDKFGMPRNTAVFAPTFAGEGVVRSDDIRLDPRYGQNSPHAGMPEGHLPVVSYLAVPVISSSGEVLGGLFFAHDEPGRFSPEAEALVSAIASQTAVAMDNARLHKAAQAEIEQRARAESAKGLLLNELQHRVKNTMATIQAMAMQTFKAAPREEVNAFISRLHALSNAHDLLTQRDWDLVGVDKVVELATRPFDGKEHPRISWKGPDVQVGSGKALMLAMVLHELGTNAVKYGALSKDGGHVDIEWHLDDKAERSIHLSWRESGGPTPAMPSSRGFGSRMIERALKAEQGESELEFAESGLICRLRLPV
jgi:PAS domain S-box-containing protein